MDAHRPESAAPTEGFDASQLPPGPAGRSLLEALVAFRQDPHACFWAMKQQYGNVAWLKFAQKGLCLISHPDEVRYIFNSHHTNFIKSDIVKFHLHASDSDLIAANGEVWRRKRRALMPAFRYQAVQSYGKLMVDETLAMLERWDFYPEDQPVAIARDLDWLGLGIICRTILGFDLRSLKLPPTTDPGTVLPTIAQKILEADAQNPGQGFMLQALRQTQNPQTGKAWSDEELLHEINVFLPAGFVTTTISLTGVLYELSKNPEVEQRLHAELSQALAGRLPTVEDLPNLPFTQMVIQETLRLYSPAGELWRQTVDACPMGHYRIPAGTDIPVLIHQIHRDPRFWDQPEKFNPDHFTPEKIAARDPYAYLPFGGGPFKCISSIFSVVELQILIATIAQRYRFRQVPDQAPTYGPTSFLIFGFQNGLSVYLQRRS
ncbi:MAG: cytochrome P450 [Chloroflexi bacterium]|nr:cytochrome P450 [Chloroflexota bacterium]